LRSRIAYKLALLLGVLIIELRFGRVDDLLRIGRLIARDLLGRDRLRRLRGVGTGLLNVGLRKVGILVDAADALRLLGIDWGDKLALISLIRRRSNVLRLVEQVVIGRLRRWVGRLRAGRSL
jgi:hypothetical protein